MEIVDVQLELRSASELQKQIDEKNGVIDGLQQQVSILFFFVFTFVLLHTSTCG